MKGRPTKSKPATQIKTQFAQTISELSAPQCANANANSDSPQKFASEFTSHQISSKKLRITRCEFLRNANANGFANGTANFRSRCGNSLRMDVCDKIRQRLRMRWRGALSFGAVCAQIVPPRFHCKISREEAEEFAQAVCQKNPRAHKNKIGTPPPPKPKIPPPKKEEFYGHGFSCRKSAFCQASIKLTHPFSGPELRTKILRTRGFF